MLHALQWNRFPLRVHSGSPYVFQRGDLYSVAYFASVAKCNKDNDNKKKNVNNVKAVLPSLRVDSGAATEENACSRRHKYNNIIIIILISGSWF